MEMADLYSLYRLVTLKIRSMSSKSNQLSAHLTKYICKFGQNPSTGSEDNSQKPSYTDANRTKNNIRLGGCN